LQLISRLRQSGWDLSFRCSLRLRFPRFMLAACATAGIIAKALMLTVP